MKKTVCVLLALGVVVMILLFLGRSRDEVDSASEPVSTEAESNPSRQQAQVSEPSDDDETDFTRDEFDQLSQEQQDELLEEFVLDFWANELELSDADSKAESLSLEIFNRPYMRTLTEREFFQLSVEDQEKAIAEVMENCTQVRKYAFNVIAEAESLMADKDYANAEVYFIHGLETGRELSVNKEGLIIARLVGIACEKLALNGLVELYTETGDNSRAQTAREELSDIEKEVQEIKRTAKEAEEGRRQTQ